METTSRSSKAFRHELATGWSALVAAFLAVAAWSACCVLPMALSVAGLRLAGTGFMAGQRDWLTTGAGLLLAGGWWMIWRRRRACAIGASCRPASRCNLALLSMATLLVMAALIWQPVIEPWALTIIRSARG